MMVVLGKTIKAKQFCSKQNKQLNESKKKTAENGKLGIIKKANISIKKNIINKAKWCSTRHTFGKQQPPVEFTKTKTRLP